MKQHTLDGQLHSLARFGAKLRAHFFYLQAKCGHTVYGKGRSLTAFSFPPWCSIWSDNKTSKSYDALVMWCSYSSLTPVTSATCDHQCGAGKSKPHQWLQFSELLHSSHLTVSSFSLSWSKPLSGNYRLLHCCNWIHLSCFVIFKLKTNYSFYKKRRCVCACVCEHLCVCVHEGVYVCVCVCMYSICIWVRIWSVLVEFCNCLWPVRD